MNEASESNTRRANIDRALMAVGAGGVGAFAAIVPGYMWFLAGFEFSLFASPEPLGVAGIFWVYVLSPAVLAAGGILPARILGEGWKAAVVISAAVSLAASLIAALSGFDLRAVSFVITAAPGVLALVVAVRNRSDPAVIPALIGVMALLILPGVLTASTILFMIAAFTSLFAWPILPGVAGLFRPQDGDIQ